MAISTTRLLRRFTPRNDKTWGFSTVSLKSLSGDEMLNQLLEGKNTESQKRLDELFKSIGDNPKICWYPSADDDYRDVLELTKIDETKLTDPIKWGGHPVNALKVVIKNGHLTENNLEHLSKRGFSNKQ